jgi:hypothetical protein
MSTGNDSPQLPTPLESCLLIEYRLSSKAKLKDHVNATQLFEQVHEPGSLATGIEMIISNRVETCIFGPSLKPEKIAEFITSSQNIRTSSQCAFMVFQASTRQASIPGAHAVLEFPCSQPHFNVGIVTALVGANGGTLPASRRTDPKTKRPISLKERLSWLEYPGQPGKAEESSATPQAVWPKSLLAAVTKNLPLLYNSLLDVHPFNLKFRSDGTPTEFTVNIIRNVIAGSFRNTEGVQSMTRFKEALEVLLYRWVQRGTAQGRAEADFILRREIRDCLRVE